jgi:hypothetical protein
MDRSAGGDLVPGSGALYTCAIAIYQMAQAARGDLPNHPLCYGSRWVGG